MEQYRNEGLREVKQENIVRLRLSSDVNQSSIVYVYVCDVYTGNPIQQRWFKRRPVYILALYTQLRQPQHRDHPTLFRIVRGFFYVPQNYQHSRNCETGPPAYRPSPRGLRQHFLLSCLNTLSVGPVGVSKSRPVRDSLQTRH